MHNYIKSVLNSVLKPARYIGNELNSIHKEHKDKVKFALAYPDIYEIGMSNYGLQILYHILNKEKDIVAERFFTPWVDMEEKMKLNNISLFSLESCTPIKNFDVVGFSLENELTFTNLLNMLTLSQIPLFRKDRKNDMPIIIAGGACTTNPYPLYDFIDAFVLGDGEEVILEIAQTIKEFKGNKERILEKLAKIEGIFVPDFNKLENIKRRIVRDINTIDYPIAPVVPFIQIVHDRAMIEIMRGCPRRCKFCQAGAINKPVRILSIDKILFLAKELIKNTGYEEISLISLSSSDYPKLEEVIDKLYNFLEPKKVSLSLPSIRADTLNEKLIKKVTLIRSSGFTIAPEAGSQRLRNLINKDLTEEKILNSVISVVKSNINRIKLYFMIGLPTETQKDIEDIVTLSNKIVESIKPINKKAKIVVNVSTFVPKKGTAFENEKMISLEETLEKQNYLKDNLRDRSIELKWHDPFMSQIEGLFATGGLETQKILLNAYQLGCKFDNWVEHFDKDKWRQAIAQS